MTRINKPLIKATATAITLSGIIMAMGAPVKWGFRSFFGL